MTPLQNHNQAFTATDIIIVCYILYSTNVRKLDWHV